MTAGRKRPTVGSGSGGGARHSKSVACTAVRSGRWCVSTHGIPRRRGGGGRASRHVWIRIRSGTTRTKTGPRVERRVGQSASCGRKPSLDCTTVRVLTGSAGSARVRVSQEGARGQAGGASPQVAHLRSSPGARAGIPRCARAHACATTSSHAPQVGCWNTLAPDWARRRIRSRIRALAIFFLCVVSSAGDFAAAL